jgi:hypothetical protein
MKDTTMNRSVRNGIAIAGMAGGIFFLGQAVASADQTAMAANNGDQSSSAQGSGGDSAAGNANFSDAEATNVQKTEVDTDVNGGDGGKNIAVINTGVIAGGGQNMVTTQSTEQGQQFTKIEFNSGDVVLHQSADGGDVNNSGNVHVADNGGNQTATATNNVDQHADADSGDDGKKWDDSEAGNINKSSAEATNIAITDIETDVDGGDGGYNEAEINTGIIGNTFYCYEGSKCVYDFHTGDVKLVQEANGGDVNNSGNVNVGDSYGHPHADHHKPGHHDADCACHKPAVAPAKPVHHRTAHKAPVSTYAQPKGELAYTGAETTAPLALGLIALGAGGALTLAGRLHISTPAVRSAPLAHHPLISASLPTQRWRAHSRRTRTR